MIKAIMAVDEEYGVSKDGTLPWPDNPTDLKWFEDNTIGHVVIMGSKTYDDPHMPRPMPMRTNYVVTSRPLDYEKVNRISTAIPQTIRELEKYYKDKIIWIIGGPNLISQTLHLVQEFYLSRIPGKHNCDTFLDMEPIRENYIRNTKVINTNVTFEIWRKKR